MNVSLFNPDDRPAPDRLEEEADLMLGRRGILPGTAAGAVWRYLYRLANGQPDDLRTTHEAIQDSTGLPFSTVRYGLEKLKRAKLIDTTSKPLRRGIVVHVLRSAPPDKQGSFLVDDRPRPLGLVGVEAAVSAPLAQHGNAAVSAPLAQHGNTGSREDNGDDVACVRARKREREKISFFDSSRQQLLPELLLRAACDLYRRLDPTSLPWVALSAIVAIEQGWLPGEIVDGRLRSAELDSLVDRCRGGRNFGKRLRTEVGDRVWRDALTAGPLKEHLQDRHVRWDAARWEKPPDPRRPTPAEVLFGVGGERRASPVTIPSRPASPPPDADLEARFGATADAMTLDQQLALVTGDMPPKAAEAERHLLRGLSAMLRERVLLRLSEQQPRAP